MMVFGVAAIVAAFVKGMTASSLGEAAASIGLAGLTVGIFIAFGVQTKYRQARAVACATGSSEGTLA
jgi:hypothetical protein